MSDLVIHVLVLSSAVPPYDALHTAQFRTWDSVFVRDVITNYYYDDPRNFGDTSYLTGCLKGWLDLNYKFDFVFRTNSSSYVDKIKLLEHAQTLPRERCYQGVDAGGFASGSGFWLSRDLAEILSRELPDRSDKVDDEVVGEILAAHGIKNLPGARRVDFYDRPEYVDDYHYRCKSSDPDRRGDIEAMRLIHRMKGFAVEDT